MKIHSNPEQQEWTQLLKRPTKDATELNSIVAEVLRQVKERGDEAVREYEMKFDHVSLTSLAVSEEEMIEAERMVSDELKEAMLLAHRNIHHFHSSQKIEELKCEVTEGVTCWQKPIAIERVGLYIPGGTAPLFSTVLMLATPARIARCKEIVLCTPPSPDGKVNPAILMASRIAGVNKIYKIGGVQAIGAMAYGTESVPNVFKIFGPGNQYVMTAKQQVSLHGVAIDMPAGPSEVEVIADESSNPSFVAADLLSQAEHGTDSQVLLVTTSERIIPLVVAEVEKQLEALPRKEIAKKALDNSKIILLSNDEDVMLLTNQYAPEHLIIETQNAHELATKVINAGSVFIGSLTPESAGDYASGTNHTLPTSGYAVAYNGVNIDSYFRKVTFQELTPKGLTAIGKAVETMAEAEQLYGHKKAITLRLQSL